VETQVLPLPENLLISEVRSGPVRGQAAAGAVRHREARDRVRPDPQLVEIKAEAEIYLLRVRGAGAVDAPRVGHRFADVMGDHIDALFLQLLAEGQVAE